MMWLEVSLPPTGRANNKLNYDVDLSCPHDNLSGFFESEQKTLGFSYLMNIYAVVLEGAFLSHQSNEIPFRRARLIWR